MSVLTLTPYLNPLEWTPAEWDDVREWLIAIGTVGAVITALVVAGRPDRAARRRRPSLSLSLDDQLGLTIECVTLFENDTPVGSTPATWIRLSVTNAKGKDTATDVELFAARITEPDAGDTQRFAHVSFPPFGWPHVEDPRMDVPSGVTRLIDIGWVDMDPGNALKDKLQLRIVPNPIDQRHILKPGVYEFDLTLSAHNADARYFSMKSSSIRPRRHRSL